MNKRIEIIVATLAAFLLSLAPAVASDPASCTETVASKMGPVCGTLVTTSSGKQAKAFLGIPFAESTAGPGRWTGPVPKKPWTATLPAMAFGAACPQSAPMTANEGEDCLNLNVWKPAGAGADAKLPVMVFIYGGAFVAGDAAYALYDGANLAANRDVILVSFNYRVGVLGFLATDELSGNYGFLDQQAALTWVKDNVAAWGGDPAKVTIFGESAGAMSVGLHLFSAPGSTPLFRAAIMESNFLGLPYKRLAEQVDVGNLFKQGLGCADVKCLRETDANDLLRAQAAFTPVMSNVFSGTSFYIPFGPAIDGTLLTRQPIDGAADGADTKPVLLGANRNEGALFVRSEQMSIADYAGRVASLFGRSFEKVLARYPRRGDGNNGSSWAEVQGHALVVCSTRHVAAKAKTAYLYAFNQEPSFAVWGGPACRRDGNVCHGAELPFVFGNADKIGGRFTADEAKLSSRVMDYWTNFAAHLDPNGPSPAAAAPLWPRFGEPTKDYLMLDAPTIAVQPDPYRDTCEFWDGIGYKITDPWPSR